jgi:hypothetical protein
MAVQAIRLRASGQSVNAIEALAIDAAYAKWRASPDPWDTTAAPWRAFKAARHSYCVTLQNLLDEYEERAEAADDAMRRFRDPNRRARKSYCRRMVAEAQELFDSLNSNEDATGREVVEAWYALKRAEIDHALACKPLRDPKRPKRATIQYGDKRIAFTLSAYMAAAKRAPLTFE